jgi:hypothetical protein
LKYQREGDRPHPLLRHGGQHDNVLCFSSRWRPLLPRQHGVATSTAPYKSPAQNQPRVLLLPCLISLPCRNPNLRPTPTAGDGDLPRSSRDHHCDHRRRLVTPAQGIESRSPQSPVGARSLSPATASKSTIAVDLDHLRPRRLAQHNHGELTHLLDSLLRQFIARSLPLAV